MSTLLSIRTEEANVEILDQIAGTLDRNRNWVVNEAIRSYIEWHQWRREHLAQGRADTESGRLIGSDELLTRITKRAGRKKTGK